MENKYYTVIIVPHSTSNSRKITFSKKFVRICFLGGIILIISMGYMFYDYFTMSITREKFKNLNTQYHQQKEIIAKYESSIAGLNAKIESFKNYAKKLNIIAGLESPYALKEVGIGGPSIFNEIESTPPIQEEISVNNLEAMKERAGGIEKNLNTLVKFFEAQTIKLASTPSIWPTRGYISSAFGRRKDPFTGQRAFHKGLDIATRYGNPIYAPADGTILSASYNKDLGKTLILDHNFGFTTLYGHLSKFNVKPGQKVKRGDIIGYIGSTGRAIGPHLHYEVRIHNKPVNPFNYILED
ncbi:MAG: M23 family metallopeptidase [Candidatus Aminicenantia bacterium]